MTQKTVMHTEEPGGVRGQAQGCVSGADPLTGTTYFLFPLLGDGKLCHNCVATFIDFMKRFPTQLEHVVPCESCGRSYVHTDP